MVRQKWRDALIGSSSGVFQGAAYLEAQFVVPAAVILALAAGQLGWVTTLGYVLPVLVGLLVATGDWFGGRPLILGLAGVTLGGVALVFAGALLAELGVRELAIWFVASGLVLMPAAVRHGAMLVAHETHGLSGDDQLRRSRGLRQYLVLGIYLAPLPAGVVAERFGWPWVFGPFALLQLVGVAVLATQIKQPADRPARPKLGPFLGEFAGSLTDRWLLLAGAGAFLAQGAVFIYVSGLPARLRGEGISTGWLSLVVAGGVLAAPFVTRPRVWSSVRFGRLAGAIPLAAVIVVEAIALLTGAMRTVTAGAVLFAIGAALFAGPMIELSKQFSQSIAQLQATAAADQKRLYRRQAVVNLGGNLGALTGTLIGRMSAAAGPQPWIELLLSFTIGAWALQAAWFALFPLPWRVRVVGPGRERWCHRVREFIVVTGDPGAADSLTAIFDAPKRGDHVRLDRERVSFDPMVSTVEQELQRLRFPYRGRHRTSAHRGRHRRRAISRTGLPARSQAARARSTGSTSTSKTSPLTRTGSLKHRPAASRC